MREIEALVDFRGRSPGTDAERRAAKHLARRLEAIGREPELEPTEVWPNYPIAHVAHALLAIVGSVLAVYSPLAGTIVLLVAAVSAYGDASTRFLLVRRLTGRRASQNVVSREDDDMPGVLVLTAHYDAARTGAAFGWPTQIVARLGRLTRRPLGMFAPLVWSIAGALACAALRLAGVDALPVAIAQFAFTVVLIASVPLLADVALSGVTPGANDNASGVATVLRLADRYGGTLEHFDVWVVLPGSEEALLHGMRAWLKRHRRELSRRRTVFLNVDSVGGGTVRYVTREGLVRPLAFHPSLVALCEEIAADDAAGEAEYGARPVRMGIASDAHAARVARFAAISLSCADELDRIPDWHRATDTPERIDPEALERAYGFACELIELIDERLGPQLEEAAEGERERARG